MTTPPESFYGIFSTCRSSSAVPLIRTSSRNSSPCCPQATQRICPCAHCCRWMLTPAVARNRRGRLAHLQGQRRDARGVRGHLARRLRAGAPQRRPGGRSAVASHALSRELRHPDLRRRPPVTLGAVAAEERRPTGRPYPPAGQRTARRIVAPRHLRPDPGLRRHVAASMVCEFIGLPVELAPDVLATVNAGSLAQPGEGVKIANARPGYLDYLVPIIERRRAEAADGELPDRGQPDRLPAAGRLGAQRRRGRHPDARRLHRRHRDRAQDRRARFVGAQRASRSAGRGAGRPRGQRADRARGDDSLLRTGPVVRANAASTVRDSRHTIQPGQRIITLLGSAARDEREYADPDEFLWDRPIERLLSFGRGQHFCLGVHLARLEITVMVPSGSSGCPTSASSRSPRRGRRRVSNGAGTTSPWRSDVWCYRLVAPYTFERLRSARALARVAGRWPGAAALPGRRRLRERPARVSGDAGQAARRHRRQRRRDERVPRPRDRRRGAGQSPPRPRHGRPRRRLGVGIRRADGPGDRRRRRPVSYDPS